MLGLFILLLTMLITDFSVEGDFQVLTLALLILKLL